MKKNTSTLLKQCTNTIGFRYLIVLAHVSSPLFMWLWVHLTSSTTFCNIIIVKGFHTIPGICKKHFFLSLISSKSSNICPFSHISPRDAARNRRMRWFCLLFPKCGKTLSGKENGWKDKWNARKTCCLAQVICWERQRQHIHSHALSLCWGLHKPLYSYSIA